MMKYLISAFLVCVAFQVPAQVLDTAKVVDLLRKAESNRLVRKYDSVHHYSKMILVMPEINQREDYFTSAALMDIDALGRISDLDGANKRVEELELLFAKQKSPKPTDLGRLYLAKGRLLEYVGDMHGGRRLFKASLAEFLKINTTRGYEQQSDLYNELGINAARMSEFGLASDYFQKSLTVCDSLELIPKISNININLGNLYQLMGSYALSIEHFRKALKIQTKTLGQWHYTLSYTYNNLSGLHMELGQDNLALEYMKMSIAIAMRNGGENGEFFVDNHLQLMAIYVDLSDFDNAQKTLLTVEDALKKSPHVKLSDQAYLMFMKGYYYAAKDEADLAIDYFKKVIPLYEMLGKEKSKEIANTWSLLGYAYAQKEDYDQAINYMLQAIDGFTEVNGDKHFTVAESYNKIAPWYELNGDFSGAIEAVDNAIAATVRNYDGGVVDLSQVLHRNELLYALSTKGDLLRKHFLMSEDNTQGMEALQYYQLYDSLVRVKQETEAFSDQLSSLSDLDEVYDKIVATYSDFYAQNQDKDHFQQAFNYANRGNGVLLRHQEKQMSDRKFGRVPEGVVALEHQLKEGISYLKGQIFNLENAGEEVREEQLASLKTRLFNKSRSLDSLKTQLKERFPTYFNYMYASELPTLDKLESSLNRESTFIQYVTTEDDIFVFKLHDGEKQFIKLALDEDFYKNLNRYLDLLSNPGSGFNSEHLSLATVLYNQIISPLGELNEQLEILVDGALNRLPFETLIDPEQADAAIPYLIAKHNVAYYNNVSQLTQPKTQPKAARRLNALAIAPDYSSNRTTSNSELRANLGKLNWTVAEVEALEALYNTETYVRDKATEEIFRAYSGNKNILHIASHALVSSDDPLSSRIVFERDESDSLNDGSLFVHELYNLSLDADLVVLSACNTGSGEVADGEGIISLGRGFQYAGVPSVLLSHWQVNDQSASTIMTSFHQNLVKGQKKSEALRGAKLEYIANASNLTLHPFYWGAFVVIGDDSPLTSQNHWYLYGLALVVLGLLCYLWWRKISVAKAR